MRFSLITGFVFLALLSLRAEVPYFPLKKGSVWIYSANVEWVEGDSAKGPPPQIKKKDITYKTEVVDTHEGGNVFAARFHGFVTDLAWYTPDKKPGDCLMIQVGTNHCHIIHQDVDKIWNALVSPNGSLRIEELSGGNLLFEMPLTVGAHYGDFPNTTRGMYCWIVEDEKPFSLKTVAGAPKLKHPMEFTIVQRTNPDHEIFGFVPGLGITRFEYSHHGTTSNATAKLIRYIP
ncbi:MAG: hypothetical protein ABIP97_08935 [Chthoniobacterales bacterium]